jgi:hypothetical protein
VSCTAPVSCQPWLGSSCTRAADVTFTEVDIETDDVLVRDYGIRIPVVAVDGEELFEISVDPAAFRAAVEA